MKKVLSVLFVVLMLLSILSGYAPSANKQVSDVSGDVKKDSALANTLPDRIKSSGKIMIGLDDSYPPMEFRNEKNEMVGFDIDLGTAIGQKLGVQVEWVSTAWDGIIPSLQSKKFDMILSAMSITDDRKKEVNFSEPYIQGGPVIVTLKGNDTIKTGDDLKGKVVGCQLGSTGEDAAKSIDGIKELKSYDKITEALQDLSAKRIEAVVADDQVGRYYIGLDPNKYVVAGKMNDEPFGIAFRKDDTELSAAVQKAINELKDEGTLSKISMNWFKEDYYKK